MVKIKVNPNLTLIESEALQIAEGTSAKLFFKNGQDQYIIKKPKRRTLGRIFNASLPVDLHPYREWTFNEFREKNTQLPDTIRSQLAPYFNHLQDLMIEAALGEIIYMQVVKTLFPLSMEVPETFLHINKESGEPWVISKKIEAFNEFLRDKLVQATGRILTSSTEWLNEEPLCRADLKLSNNEFFLLGKLYCSALITNDWDLVNNIMLANSGCMGDSQTANIVCVVDGGNKFHFGFDGLTCEESAFRNPIFQLPEAHENYHFTYPFDETILPTLPRMIIKDLFELNQPALLQGMSEMLAEANRALIMNPDGIRKAINQAFTQTTIHSNHATIRRLNNTQSTLLNQSFYRQPKGYALEALLKSRLRSCAAFIHQIQQQEPDATLQNEKPDEFHQFQP